MNPAAAAGPRVAEPADFPEYVRPARPSLRFAAARVMLLGAFLSMYYVDLGISGQIPFAPGSKPAWLAGPSFGLRINVPWCETKPVVVPHSPLPFAPSSLLPSFSGRDDEGDAFD